MKCKLCLKEEKLIKRSHIIPDFMYQDIFDEKHRMVRFDPKVLSTKTSVPNSEYEGFILCKRCDNEIIGKLEDYASKVLFGGKINVSLENFIKPDGLEFTQIKGLDYTKFKLFLLSLLWRASISSRPFFKQVDLGVYEEVIRVMLLTSNPGIPEAFPCILTSYRKSKLPKEIVAAPRKIRLGHNIGYSFLIGGFLYIFKILKNEKEDWVLEAAISDSGEMKLIHAPESQARELLHSYLGVNF